MNQETLPNDSADSVQPLTEATVYEEIKDVLDPELGCNVVDLGLIYSVQIEGARVFIKMTLTTKGCPMADKLARGVKIAVLRMEQVEDANVEVVWDPPWTPSMMSKDLQERFRGFGACSG